MCDQKTSSVTVLLCIYHIPVRIADQCFKDIFLIHNNHLIIQHSFINFFLNEEQKYTNSDETSTVLSPGARLMGVTLKYLFLLFFLLSKLSFTG